MKNHKSMIFSPAPFSGREGGQGFGTTEYIFLKTITCKIEFF